MRGTSKGIFAGLAAAGVALLLYIASRQSYLLFHSLSEIFSIVVACGVFMLAWSSRQAPETRSLLVLATGYLSTAVLDVLHTLTYEGMRILPVGQDYATKLWIAARFVQAIALLAFVLSLRRRGWVRTRLLLASAGVITGLLLALIFVWNGFPTCFIEGVGVTPFKRASEYVICSILALVLVLLLLRSYGMEPVVVRLMVASIVATIASELLFTLYTSAQGLANLLGHYLKIVAFVLTYQALIAHEVRRRLETIRRLEAIQRGLVTRELALSGANAAKDRFLSILAHDLRGPLAGVRGLVDVLAGRYDEMSGCEHKKLLGMASEGIGRSMELVESLLTWVSSQSGRIDWSPAPLEVSAVVDDVLDLVRSTADRKGIGTGSTVDAGTLAYADRSMVATVLRNLLSNAVKFTPRGGRVSVSSQLDGDKVAVTVADTGVGMTDGEVQKLFRLDTHMSRPGTEQEGGNGLGLILCREFVEKHGGQIWVSSSPGEGSRFTFTLPTHAPDEVSPDRAARAPLTTRCSEESVCLRDTSPAG